MERTFKSASLKHVALRSGIQAPASVGPDLKLTDGPYELLRSFYRRTMPQKEAPEEQHAPGKTSADRTRPTRLIPKAPLTDSRRGFPGGEISIPLAREIRAMPSAVRLREDYSAEELRTLARRSKDVTRAVVFCRWLRFEMEWTGHGGEDRRHGSPDAARLGSSLQRFGAGGPHRQPNGRSQASPVGGTVGQFAKIVEAGPAVRKMASSGGGASISSMSLPKGSASTSSALCRKAPEEAWLLAHQHPAASSGSGRADRRGV